ncbi:MAG TPA: hypothetical protein VF798_05990 [Burkholderiaceae bacterium]
MNRIRSVLFCIAASALPALVQAATSEVSPASLLVVLEQEIHAKPGEVYADIGKVDKWWNKDHTFSHDAGNLSMQMAPGGCFCERWDGGAVLHGTVISLRKDSQVRLQTSLGPLQELAVTGVLTFTIAPRGEGTVLKLTYRVSGVPSSGLDKWAAPVDAMLSEQLRRLASYAEKGAPE